MSASQANFLAAASVAAMARYPLTAGVDPNWTHERRATYIQRLQECKRSPSYAQSIFGNLPCLTEPWMEEDSRGWTVYHLGRPTQRRSNRGRSRGRSYTEDHQE
jgi:hypothetical protein